MRRGKLDEQNKRRNPVKHLTTAEKLHLKRVKRKNGPSGKRRAEKRKELQLMSLVDFVNTAGGGQMKEMLSFQDAYALKVASGDSPSKQTLSAWKDSMEKLS